MLHLIITSEKKEFEILNIEFERAVQINEFRLFWIHTNFPFAVRRGLIEIRIDFECI